ncbi:hypothetical protein DNTS_033867 [Danionella cerebrum]|uniref:Fibronectin type-III domain-containing protein n=1 Tax=Danionella cerebrum TaxID=2873325 RepID=A0A553NGK0_9TELE|nr:hypothetical protein DNTS_033867 [Danionella translucida]
MGVLETLGIVLLVTLTQICSIQAQECNIVSISSPTASSLLVQWNRLLGVTNYFLDVRVVNDSNAGPVVVSVPGSISVKEVFGLRTGTLYSVTLKGFLYHSVLCVDTKISRTAPGTAQITYSKALTSTSVSLEWDWVPTALHDTASCNDYSSTADTTICSNKLATSGQGSNLPGHHQKLEFPQHSDFLKHCAQQHTGRAESFTLFFVPDLSVFRQHSLGGWRDPEFQLHH